jgi:type VI protein secretion system component Hcp
MRTPMIAVMALALATTPVFAGGKGGGGGGHATNQSPKESTSFNYGKIEHTYTQQKRSDGSGGGNVSGKYVSTKGTSARTTKGKPKISPITIKKVTDKASP